MKVAIVFSGKIRGLYEVVMEQWKNIAPFADFYFSTWNDNEYDFVEKYFEYPEVKYFPAKIFFEMHKDDNPDKALSFFRKRRESKQWIYQQYAYAKALEYFNLDKDYDVIIRARYDIRLNMTQEDLESFCKDVYENNRVVQIGHNHSVDGKEIMNINGKIKGSPDFCFIHKPTHFLPSTCYKLIESKQLKGQEVGWSQLFSNYDGHTRCLNYMEESLERHPL